MVLFPQPDKENSKTANTDQTTNKNKDVFAHLKFCLIALLPKGRRLGCIASIEKNMPAANSNQRKIMFHKRESSSFQGPAGHFYRIDFSIPKRIEPRPRWTLSSLDQLSRALLYHSAVC